MQSLIPIAKKLSANYYVPGLDFDDKVQECLIAAWQHPQPTKARSRTVMFRRLWALGQKRQPEVESFNEEIHSSLNQVFFVAKGETRKLFLAIHRANGCFKDAAELLGMSQRRIYYEVQKVRETLSPSEVVL